MKNGSLMSTDKIRQKKPIIGIIGGTGRFGQWFKFFFENTGHRVLIAGRKTALTHRQLAAKSDIVIVSVPIGTAAEVIKNIRNYIKKSALLCDFTSIKEKTINEMKKAESGVLGIHPLFGPLAASIKNQIIIFCPVRKNKWIDYLKRIFEENGAKVIFSSAKEHDRQMAMVQSLTHFINIILARTLQSQKLDVNNAFTTPIFRLQSILMGRILGNNPELYADLEIENPYFIKILDKLSAEFKDFYSLIKNKNHEGFIKKFEAAAYSMRNFIPVAQIKSVEILSLLDRQPVELKKSDKKINFESAIKSRIAFLGPEGTYSHQALLDTFGKKAEPISSQTISNVFEKVGEKEAEFGIVPAENSSEGVIQETLDNLAKNSLKIIGSYNLKIHHCLLARTGDIRKIKTIKSHPQPLAQCRNWISKNFPQAVLETESSSTKAILSTNDSSVAFIASRQSAKKYGLKILFENIEDKKNNITQFYILSRNDYPKISSQLQAAKTLILLAVYDRPGVLRDVLNSFAERKLNLSKLYSRPSRVVEMKDWDYYFFLEVEKLPNNPDLKSAMEEIKKYCSIARVLGIT